jgi:ABC-type multidrug transport system fused ATPase/permease subunit
MNAFTLLAQVDPTPQIIGGMFFMMAVIWVTAIVATVFWLWMLIDALVNEPGTNEKILWFLVIFLLHVVGAVIYFVVRRQGAGRALSGGRRASSA